MCTIVNAHPLVFLQATSWVKTGLLVDSLEFRRTCEFYFGDITFEEAFTRTGKHVCITVSASRASGDSAQRLLLNHISTPHVTIASAVAASCALPGVMAPAKLLCKGNTGAMEAFEVDGVDWIDGSVQADLPFQRIATLFAVSSFIVSQTNFHVVPFVSKENNPGSRSRYWQLFQAMEWDIRSRALKLSRLGLFPKIFGQDISKVFKQKYHGNLTIVPKFTAMQTFGLHALANPTVADMEHYLKHGQIAAWPYLRAIRDMLRVERALEDCLLRLEARCREVCPDVDWGSSNDDDVESITSSSIPAGGSSSAGRHPQQRMVRIIGRPPGVGGANSARENYNNERMKTKMTRLEQENSALREQLALLHATLNQRELSVSPTSSTARNHDATMESHEVNESYISGISERKEDDDSNYSEGKCLSDDSAENPWEKILDEPNP
jgi:Patatin-like phospholipase